MDKIKIAISSCVLGESVRYNGGHKRSPFCTDSLSEHFDFVSLCPEVGIGLGVPREPIRLVGDLASPRVVGVKNPDLDVTDQLQQYADSVVTSVSDCCGYILMKDSPSCGLYSAKVYTEKGVHMKRRAGIFADRIKHLLPLLPMEESGRLNDSALRENFINRVYLFSDWKSCLQSTPSPKALVDFHSRHKYMAMSYSQHLYRQLGRMVASAGAAEITQLSESYIAAFMAGSAKPPSRKGHVNVLFHLLGYLKASLPPAIRQDLTQSVEQYRYAHVPLSVPMTLLGHYLEHYGSDYVKQQSYLQPHPASLGLRNSI